MRAYSIIALAIGGLAGLACLPVLHVETFGPVTARLQSIYSGWGWIDPAAPLRIRWLEISLLLLSPISIAQGLVESTRVIERVLVAGLSLGLLLLASPTFAMHGILIDPVILPLAGLFSTIGCAMFARTRLGRRKRFLESALGNRVSGTVFRELLEGRSEPELAGVSRETATLICRMFTDPQDGELAPEEVLKRGSHFRRTVTGFLLSRGAVINEAGPEKIRATFGMLREEANPAELACRAALELRGRLRGLSLECETRWFRPLRWGIGVASGQSIIGLCGTMDEPVLSLVGGGDEFADRLALANARLDSDLLLETETSRRVQTEFETRPLEILYDPERQSLREVYQLLAETSQLSEEERQRRDHFWKGVILLRERKPEAALEAFSKARPTTGEDPVLARFLTLAQEGAAAPESRNARLAREFTDDGYSRLLQKL